MLLPCRVPLALGGLNPYRLAYAKLAPCAELSLYAALLPPPCMELLWRPELSMYAALLPPPCMELLWRPELSLYAALLPSPSMELLWRPELLLYAVLLPPPCMELLWRPELSLYAALLPPPYAELFLCANAMGLLPHPAGLRPWLLLCIVFCVAVLAAPVSPAAAAASTPRIEPSPMCIASPGLATESLLGYGYNNEAVAKGLWLLL